LLGWIAFMAADNQPPYEYDAENSFIIPSVADDGDQIRVMWKITKVNRICPGSNRRVLFDPKTGAHIATYDPTPAAFSDSLRDGYLNRAFQLPRQLPSGPIGYRATVCYECNPFQKFLKPLCVTTPDLFFTIR
ncbi:MAG TPA: hypothetical protein VHK86_08790, partial [Nitrososphaera sp.]|nr:hypothetical protein [Nitrososphaera sp.]